MNPCSIRRTPFSPTGCASRCRRSCSARTSRAKSSSSICRQLLGRNDSADLADAARGLLSLPAARFRRALQRGQSRRTGAGHEPRRGEDPPHPRPVRAAFARLDAPPGEACAAARTRWCESWACSPWRARYSMVLLFGGYKVALGSGVSDVRAIAVRRLNNRRSA